MQIDLNGKVALITGAAGTIGRTTAAVLARNGAIVFLNDIAEPALEKLTGDITDEGGIAYYQKGDVTSAKDIARFVQFAVSRCGGIDILVNNAGLNVSFEFRKPLYQYDIMAWRHVIDVCLDSVYYCCRFTMPYMKEKISGKIINIGSVAGFNAPLKLQSAYSMAKAAVINITKSMALEYATKNINVNAVVPGSIMNEQIKVAVYEDLERKESMLAHIPQKRTGEPIDIANAVLFLASEESSYITGSALIVDGGWSCGYALPLAD